MENRKFGRNADHRVAMLRNLATSLIVNGKIETTEMKAMDLRSVVDELITTAKRNDLHARRQVAAYLRDVVADKKTGQTALQKLFDEIAPKYADRNGGYTRVMKTSVRRGDAAPMATIELVQKTGEHLLPFLIMFDIDKLRESAIKDRVPIMQESGILYCKEFIKEKKIKSILEIGTAVGYWSICMASIDNGIQITTIEYDEDRYKQAINNVKLSNKEAQINCIHLDAKDYVPNQMFDLIFLDGPKAQHKNYFNQFISYLNPNGYIIVDNMSFHGHVENRENLSHRRGLQKMVNKIAKFQDWIINHPDYVTMEQDIADGVLVIWRKYPEVIRYDMITKGE